MHENYTTHLYWNSLKKKDYLDGAEPDDQVADLIHRVCVRARVCVCVRALALALALVCVRVCVCV